MKDLRPARTCTIKYQVGRYAYFQTRSLSFFNAAFFFFLQRPRGVGFLKIRFLIVYKTRIKQKSHRIHNYCLQITCGSLRENNLTCRIFRVSLLHVCSRQNRPIKIVVVLSLSLSLSWYVTSYRIFLKVALASFRRKNTPYTECSTRSACVIFRRKTISCYSASTFLAFDPRVSTKIRAISRPCNRTPVAYKCKYFVRASKIVVLIFAMNVSFRVINKTNDKYS